MSDDALNKNALLALLNGESAPAPKQPSVMRAATTKERVSDTLRGFYEWIAKQPLLRATDALGATDVQGVAKELDGPGRGLQMGMMPEGPGGLKKAIRAFHGSPHDFDKFEMSKIGTGEGAQAYGHGLYFAENEGVAKSYRDTLQTPTVEIMGQAHQVPSWNAGMSPQPRLIRRLADIRATHPNEPEQAVIDQVRRNIQFELAGKFQDNASRNALQQELDILAAAEQRGIKTSPGGKMYEVDIHADPDDFLDWDAPLSQQSEKVQKALGSYGVKESPETLTARTTGADAIRSKLRGVSDSEGVVLRPEDALKRKGIPGIKYYDSMSRAAKEGTRNYVVFDEKLVSIVKKLGVAGALTAGLINESQAEQLKAQGHQ